MTGLKHIEERLEKNDFAIGDCIWLHLRTGKMQLEVIRIDTEHEYDMPLFAITDIDIFPKKSQEFEEER